MTVLPRVVYPTNLSLPHLPWYAALRAIGRKVFRFPVLRGLRPLARRAIAVADPPTYLTGRPEPPAAAAPKETLTALSANLWHDWPQYRRLTERLEAFANLVTETGADLVLLQEVARTPQIQADEWLARRLGMSYVYVRANGHLEAIGFEEGLAIFSRYPLNRPETAQLGRSANPFTRRLALSAQVETHFGPLQAVSTHLSLKPKKNARQVEHLRGWVEEISAGIPALIGGDFNAGETSRQMAAARRAWLDLFRHLHPEKDGATHQLKLPCGKIRRRRLDYVFLKPGERGWGVDSVEHLPELPSDHDAVLARLRPAGG